MKKLIHCASALAIGLPMSMGVAHAAEGYYGKVDGTYSFAGRMNFSTPARGGFPNLLGSGPRDTDKGFSGGGIGVGRSWDSGWRVEAEVRRHSTDMKKDFEVLSGKGEATLLMVNGYMDFNTDSFVQPYVGAGIGYGMFDIKAATSPAPSNQVANGDANNLAYQVQAGLGLRMSETMSLDLGWRYIGTDQLKISLTSVQPPTAAGYKTEVDYHESSVTVGLRMHF